MKFTGTVTTSGTSFVTVIPRKIVEMLGLKQGMKVNMEFENEQLIISFDLRGLLPQCERILYGQLDTLICKVISDSFKVHPVTSQILSKILGLIKDIYFEEYGPDNLKMKILDHIVDLVQPDPNLGKLIEGYQRKVVDDLNKPIGLAWQRVGESEMNSKEYKEFLKFEKLIDETPLIKEFDNKTEIVQGMTRIMKDRDRCPNYNEMKCILDFFESDDFKKFFKKLELIEYKRRKI